MSHGILNIVGLDFFPKLFLYPLQLREAALFSAASKTLWNIRPECRLLIHLCDRQTRKGPTLPYEECEWGEFFSYGCVWHTIWEDVEKALMLEHASGIRHGRTVAFAERERERKAARRKQLRETAARRKQLRDARNGQTGRD